jgi:uncharacterized protein YabN with tetrapyrrole methylase and pyrophosphatase domain
MNPTSLIIVGTGIYAGHLTQESRGWIETADRVLYCVSDPATERLLMKLNPKTESLYCYYDENKPRIETYRQMTQRTLECLREGGLICAVYYGHPGLFVAPSHASIEAARAEGYPARMLPAVSSIDCLFCDLGIDPAGGLQVFEATDLVLRRRFLDSQSHIVVLQVSALGERGYSYSGWTGRNATHLKEHLLRFFEPNHEVTFYTAPQFPICEPTITKAALSGLDTPELSFYSTLYIPPAKRAPIHISSMRRLGMDDVLSQVELVPIDRGSS